MRVPYRRLLIYAIAFAVAIVMNFLLPRLMPGSPVEAMIAQFGKRATPAMIEAIKMRFGQGDATLLEQFWVYLKGVASLDLGVSTKFYPQTVVEVLGRSIGWTGLLVTTSIIFSFALGSLLGTVSAWRRGSRFDGIVSPLAVVLLALPPVVIAICALFLFAVSLRWLPLGYAWDPALDPGLSFAFLGSVAWHAILPVFTLSLFLIGDFQATMRNNMISVLGEDYITMARAKGLGETTVMFSYAARNAVLPNLTSLALALGSVFGGSIVTEVVFNYPGLGLTLFQAAISRDYPVIQGQLLIMTLATLAANLAVDIAYLWLDPRLRDQPA